MRANLNPNSNLPPAPRSPTSSSSCWTPLNPNPTPPHTHRQIPNHLILALDTETKVWCGTKGINAHLMELQVQKAQQGTGDNHAVSAMKFGILKQFLELGWWVAGSWI